MNLGTQSTVHERAKKSGKPAPGPGTTAARVNEEARHKMIAEAAYYLAQRRGFNDGHALEDWLQAEARIDAMLTTMSARR